MKFTPENITELQENQIFVFGSNANGNHAGGAARIAVDKFEAIEGQSEGLQGKSYAIVTLDKKMKKVSLESISKSIDALYQFATENENLEFLVTKIGCGIAGFEEKEIESIFKSKETPKNIILPIEFSKVQGFKGFDKDMKCRGFQYEENKEYSEGVEPEICNRGLHFCPMPLDVFNYYPPVNGASYAHVESLGKISIGEDKAATDKLKIKTKLSIANLFKLHFDLTFDKVRNEIKYSKETQSTSGYKAHSSTSGNYAHSSTSGYKAHSSTSGEEAHSSTTGDEAHSSTSGKNSIASSLGINSKAKASLGNWIILTEWERDSNHDWQIKEVKTAKIDGEILKPDVYYQLMNGQFTEVEE